MDTIASTKFRKRFASLEKPVTVTVNGHVLGTWLPGVLYSPEGQTRLDAMPWPPAAWGKVNSPEDRPFTPVPKPTRRK